VPVNVNADDLTSMEDSIYHSSSSSSSSSEVSPNSASATPPEDMEMGPSEADPNPVTDNVVMPDSNDLPLQSVGDHNRP